VHETLPRAQKKPFVTNDLDDGPKSAATEQEHHHNYNQDQFH
jgi:hypothetical protein